MMILSMWTHLPLTRDAKQSKCGIVRTPVGIWAGRWGFPVAAGSPGGPTPYCDPANANSVSATGAKLSSLGGYGSTFAAFEIIDLPNQPGILYAGPNQIQIPFGCGERCVGGGVIRFGVVFATSNVATTVVDMTSGPGLDNVQFWYRDPDQTSLCGSSFNLSNALAD